MARQEYKKNNPLDKRALGDGEGSPNLQSARPSMARPSAAAFQRGAGSTGTPAGYSGGGSAGSKNIRPTSTSSVLDNIDDVLASNEQAMGGVNSALNQSSGEITEKKALGKAVRDGSAFNKEADNDTSDSSEDDDSLFNDEPKKRGFRNWSPGKKASTAATGFIGVGAIGMILMGVGPFEFIHFAQSLQNFHFGENESLFDGRVGRIINYSRGDLYRSNLGVSRNKIADIYETKLREAGFEADYNDPNGNPRGSIQAYQIDPETSEGKSALASLRGDNVEIPDPDPNTGKIRVSLRGRGSTELSRQVIDASLGSIGLKKVPSWVATRLLYIRAGIDFHVMRNRFREETETVRDYYRKTQDDVETYTEEGSQDVGERARTAEEVEGDTDEDSAARSAAQAEADALQGATPAETVVNLRRAIAGASSVVGIFTIIATLDKFGDNIGDVQYTNVVLPLMRIGMSVISTGSQAASNQDFNAQLMGSYAQQLFNPADGTVWSAAKSIQSEYENPNPGNLDMPDAAKPSTGKPIFFQSLDGIIDSIPGGQNAADFLTSTVGGYASFALDVITSTTPAGLLKTIVGEVAGTVAADAATPFLEDIAQWLSSKPVESFARGALFGNYANYGALLGANDTCLAVGCVELSDDDAAILDADVENLYETQLANKGLYARLFDPREHGSLVATTVLQNPHFSRPQIAATQVAQLPTTLFSQLGSTFSNLFTPKLRAQGSKNYDYGFPKYGFTLDLQNDPKYENPFENAAKVYDEYDLDELNREYGEKCFNTTITREGKVKTTKSKRLDEIPKDHCGSTDEKVIRYRFLILDTVAMKGLECLNDIDEAACGELGFADEVDSGDDGTLPDGDAAALAQAILDNPEIGKDHPEQFQSIVDTGKPCPNVNSDYTVDAELLRVIAALGQNNSFTVSSLHRGCTGSTVGAGSRSRHWRGKAADISGSRPINGVPIPDFSSHNPIIQDFINEAAGYLPAGCELGVPNSEYIAGVEATSPACTNIFLDTPGTTGATAPHVHLGVP